MTTEPPIDTRTHRALAGATRVRVLECLRATWPDAATAADLGERLGVHPNTVRLHLDQLLDAGLVERRAERRGAPGRPRLLFAAPPARPEPAAGSPSDETESYKTLAAILAGQLAREGGGGRAGAIDAGRSWGHSLPAEQGTRSAATAEVAGAEEAMARFVGLMDRMGFAPAVPGAGDAVELHRCPFSEVAAQQPEVVCGVHLGLMEAVLEDLGAPLRPSRLEPFVAPGLCRAHLSPLAGFQSEFHPEFHPDERTTR